MRVIDASGLHYKILNEKIHEALQAGEKEIVLKNVEGQRYIADNLQGTDVKIVIEGTPGNDLAAFMDGPSVYVEGNGQDGIANTMNSGKVVVRGNAGDVLAYGMRSGRLYVKGYAGYRIGIHMKGVEDKYPVVIIGQSAGDFFGEYMAGGILAVLGLNKPKDEPILGNYIATGMHGGTIYIRSKDIKKSQLGLEVSMFDLDEEDFKRLKPYLEEYATDVGIDIEEILAGEFIKLIPVSKRPYGRLYVY